MRYLPLIASLENLRSAFRHIAANRSGPGSDGLTLEQFSEQLEQNLSQISYEILHETYQFQPALGIELSKQNRIVFALIVRDRIVTQAIHQVLYDPLENYLHPANYSYRMGRSAVEASVLLQKELMQKEFSYVLKCDIYHYFDSVNHGILYNFLSKCLGEEGTHTIHLVFRALKIPCLIRGELRKTTQGICQGSPLSPLLSNLYLAPFDRYLEKRGFRHLRFCDDIIILLHTQEEGQPLWQELDNFIGNHLRLKLHPQKGGIFSFNEGFDFLGFHFSPCGRVPSKEASERLQARIQNAKDQVEKIEAVQRWEAYYGKGSSLAIPTANSEPKEEIFETPGCPKIVSLFLELFRGNSHTFAHAYQTEERYGYVPVHRKLVEADIIAHLLGKEMLGVYLLDGDQAAFTCLDIDMEKDILEDYAKNKPGQLSIYRDTLLQHTRHIQKILQEIGIEALLEESGYKGYHLWIFAQNFVPAALIVQFWKTILEYAGPVPIQTKREIFPKETSANGRLGSLIKLPLGIHPHSGRRSMFLDKAGAHISNPQSLLQNVSKATASMFQAIVKKQNLPAPSNIEILIRKCNVVQHLCAKATQSRTLGHFERCILLYTIGHLGEDGEKYLHYLIKHCKNYNYNITQKYIEKKHSSPMGCRRIQEIMGESLNEIECCCTFPNMPSHGYVSPILHIDPNATKNWGGRKGKG